VTIGGAAGFPGTSARAQSICDDSDLVFVGRAEAPVTFLVSGEAEIEKARQNLIRTEKEIAQFKASLDERTRLERNVEFTIRLIRAKEELDMRRAMYPPPQQVTFTPLHVVTPFRGVTESTLMVHTLPEQPPMQAGEEYLVYGSRSTRLIPPFPEMGDLASLADYVEAQFVYLAESAQQRLQFLASTTAGATVIGTLHIRSFGGPPRPLGGVRILVASGNQLVETATREDGGFVAAGIRPGDLDITAALSSDMTLVDRPTPKISVREGGCTIVGLQAAVNGRVRGRIVGTYDVPLDTVELQLRTAHTDRRRSGSHDPTFRGMARADGTYEFVGVSAGTYLLSAFVKRADGRQPFTMTYYPGTDDLDAATPVVVGRATLHDGFDFVIRTQ
jgi:hypothetical protein